MIYGGIEIGGIETIPNLMFIIYIYPVHMGLPHDTSEPRSQQFSVQHRGRRRANSGSHAKFSSAVAASPAQQMHPIHLMFLEVAILWMNQKK
jgi:hypothetical protein